MSILKVSNVTCRIEDTLAVDAISFSQKKSEKLAIAGETGSGKSTLLKMIAGIIQPDKGAILFNNERIAGPDEKLVAGHPGIAYLSQHFELQKFLRVEQVLEYANKLSADEAQTLFEVCRIDHLLKRKTHELSGGEKQRIAIARLLLSAPRLLLLDEPFSNLDMAQKDTLRLVVNDLCETLSITCILVSHDAQDVLPWADKILVMESSRVIQKGTPEEIYRYPKSEYAAGLFGQYSMIQVNRKLFTVQDKFRKGETIFARPEDFQLVPRPGTGVKGVVCQCYFHGNYYDTVIELDRGGVIHVQTGSMFKPGRTVYVSYRRNWK